MLRSMFAVVGMVWVAGWLLDATQSFERLPAGAFQLPSFEMPDLSRIGETPSDGKERENDAQERSVQRYILQAMR